MQPIHAVTGAFGYTGRFIAQELHSRGHRVRTLTNSQPPPSEESATPLEVHPLNLDDPRSLEGALEGVQVLYNTFWVRFEAEGFEQELAIARSANLFRAARSAGVERVVHISITNPSEDSPWAYFRGKAQIERALRESGLPHSILRPALVFGEGGILVNNIAWMLRRFPVFGVFGRGDYGVRPIHVRDLARLAVSEGAVEGQRTLDAVGPERFEYRELVDTLAKAIHCRCLRFRLPLGLGRVAARLLGLVTGDIVLTGEEIEALMAGLLDSDAPTTGEIRFSEWAREHADELGRSYAHEVARRRPVA